MFTQKYSTTSPKLERLSLHDNIKWEDFERLVQKLAVKRFAGKIKDVLRYGRSGQKQHGADILAFNPRTGDSYIFQCKHVKKISKNQIGDWVEEFLQNKLSREATKYFLCTTFSVEQDTNLVDEWRKVSRRLAEKEIDAELWDDNKLQEHLRKEKEIIEELFGIDIAKQFCVEDLNNHTSDYIEIYRDKYSQHSSNSAIFENTTARLDLILPSSNTQLSAAISFAKNDLRGVSFAFNAPELVSWFQWRAHSSQDEPRPYATYAPATKRYVFNAPFARFTLNFDEVQHIDWIFRKAWDLILEHAQEQEKTWQTLRFQRIKHSQDRECYALISMDRKLWRLILGFVREHDYSNGNTDFHIFDSAPGVLKVYVQSYRAGLSPGYHLISYAHAEPGITSPWERNIVIGWSPLTDLSGAHVKVDSENAWDAEYAHDWFLSKLIPAVSDWYQKTNSKSENFLQRVLNKTTLSKSVQPVDLSEHCFSLAQTPVREIAQCAADIVGLSEAVAVLQRHFNSSGNGHPVDTLVTRNILKTTARLLTYVSGEPDSYYIRSKLSLGESEPLKEAVEKLSVSTLLKPSSGWVDISLRCLLSVIEQIKSLPPNELDRAVQGLMPAWQRFKEDLLCDSLK